MKTNLLSLSNIKHNCPKAFKINWKKSKKFIDLNENNQM